jgi:hypothetical protein
METAGAGPQTLKTKWDEISERSPNRVAAINPSRPHNDYTRSVMLIISSRKAQVFAAQGSGIYFRGVWARL